MFLCFAFDLCSLEQCRVVHVYMRVCVQMSVQSWGQLAAKLEEICTRLTAIEAVTMSNNNIVNNPSSNSSSGVTVGTTEQSSPRA